MSEICHQCTLVCSHCTSEMLLIGCLPNLPPRRRVTVFRCENCNQVVAQEDTSNCGFSAWAPGETDGQGP